MNADDMEIAAAITTHAEIVQRDLFSQARRHRLEGGAAVAEGLRSARFVSVTPSRFTFSVRPAFHPDEEEPSVVTEVLERLFAWAGRFWICLAAVCLTTTIIVQVSLWVSHR